jgi:hypothetical protein
MNELRTAHINLIDAADEERNRNNMAPVEFLACGSTV